MQNQTIPDQNTLNQSVPDQYLQTAVDEPNQPMMQPQTQTKVGVTKKKCSIEVKLTIALFSLVAIVIIVGGIVDVVDFEGKTGISTYDYDYIMATTISIGATTAPPTISAMKVTLTIAMSAQSSPTATSPLRATSVPPSTPPTIAPATTLPPEPTTTSTTTTKHQ